MPNFGAPIAPFVSAVVQTEVQNLLVTYEPQMAADFVTDALVPPLIIAGILMGGGVHYCHAKIALRAVQNEIQLPMRYAAQCPTLNAVSSGTVICDLVSSYANCILIERLHKF